MENAAIARQGNLQRAEWRQKCRQTLSGHLKTKLGLVVDPAQVRLKPNAEDKYTWAALPGKEHLFDKQLSKHSIGAYMELCREVGETFEAMAHPPSSVEASSEITQNSGPAGSATFTSTIRQLQEENDILIEDLSRLKQETGADSAARLHAEKRAEQLQLDLHSAQSRLETLGQENGKLSSKVRRLTRKVSRFEKDITKASSIIQRLCPAATHVENEDLQ